MKVLSIDYQSGLDFSDVTKYIPTLTVDNGVVTDGEIWHLKVSLKGKKSFRHLFIDVNTMEFAYLENTQEISDLLYSIGDIFISYYNQYKPDIDSLIDYIRKDL
ncbi:hypothetical protein ACNSOL_12300 (plasmid) [Aliarcobacter lanthieri]|uniref:hypothetical protein n=1 Tax=Aliarcobacter lanthieri TaxID=1355374 RepID=UPI003AAD3D3E